MDNKAPKPQAQEEEPKSPGPEPDLLKIDIGWEEAIRKSLEKKKPANGWPK
jgi:hypothetical protein